MATITWLHLSDLHFRADKPQQWDEDIVLRALLEDLEQRKEQDDLRPDLILVSGDLAYSGQAAEYTIARAFLNDLLQVAGLPKDRLLVVPGNHDVDRNGIGVTARLLAPTLTTRDAINEVLGDASARRAFCERFDAYGSFLGDYLGRSLSIEDGYYFDVCHFNLAGRHVAVLELNSAWLAHGGDEDRNRLALGERQVHDALTRAAGADIKIALLHHPFEWLRDADRDVCEALLKERCDFILHGHQHRAGMVCMRDPDAIAGGASGPGTWRATNTWKAGSSLSAWR